jgi:integrase
MEMRHVIRPDRVSDTKSSKRKGVTKAKVDQEDDAARRYRSLSLALQLLRDFHRLMSREFGVEDPDWSEISITDELLSISPGLITEAEYSFALRMLAPTPVQASREQLARASILISAYRFGLRGDEAAGLFRADWVDAQPDSLVVLVRGNRLRRLKTPAAQRQVPLLFELTDHEKEIISSWLTSWEGITTLNGEGPLLAQQAAPDALMNGKLLRHQVNQVIKQATCNPGLSLHHARHTFANRVAMLLMSGTEELWPHAASSTQINELRKNHVQRLLLSTNQVTRRSLWALARLLGHAHPQTTVRSYLHLLPELSAKYLNLPAVAKRPVSQDLSSSVLNLDELAFQDDYLQSKQIQFEEPPSFELTADRALRFLHLCQRGIAIPRARKVTGLTEEDADRLIHGVQQVDSILARRPAINFPTDGPFNLLGHIPQNRWAELIKLAQRVTWVRNIDEPIELGTNDVPLIIGSSRQIVMWKPEHFKFFKVILDSWQLDEKCYRIVSDPLSTPYL